MIGILRVLNQIIKTSGADTASALDESLTALSSHVKERATLMGNTLVRQLMTKLVCRRVLAYLPPESPEDENQR